MKHISILIPRGDYSVVNIMGCRQMLAAASHRHKMQSGKDLFCIDLVGFEEADRPKPGRAEVAPTKQWQDIARTDLILIPAVHQAPNVVIQNNTSLIAFVSEQYQKGATVASLCIGAYLLAATGLMNGKSCSTHWQHAAELKALFPEVRVKEERIITDEQRLITSGGAYAFTNLILYVVEKFGGRELALFLAKTFMIDIDRTRQSVYSQFIGAKQHADEVVLQVQDFIENHFAEKFTIAQLAEKFHLVRRTLERRFKSATGFSIVKYTQKVRVEKAKRQLEKGRKSVTEVMYDCGYNDPKSFREVFKKNVGITPLEYSRKFEQVW
ncbi:GlxA family transcriptional regulator [Thermophagus xiamenensis]|uniref:Transcriptional regulator, AraC family with amidase-like domain n=1 Tax=Thermophagus xiamenensis TaxID=385682 RepID=A0A1I1W9W1_9BACT|nr:helix-turn-helix domain-containing protein [Thermophagus xiamenensis]SFD91789.1 transcriptional regulator, AraC family with amidase-like domain [Thermophagus xiamenensis]